MLLFRIFAPLSFCQVVIFRLQAKNDGFLFEKNVLVGVIIL